MKQAGPRRPWVALFGAWLALSCTENDKTSAVDAGGGSDQAGSPAVDSTVDGVEATASGNSFEPSTGGSLGELPEGGMVSAAGVAPDAEPVDGGAGGQAGSESLGGDSGAGGSSSVSSGGIHLDGRRLLVNQEPFYLRGVCWNPVPRGQGHPAGLDYAGFAPTDIPLMVEAGINVVRTYEPLLDTDVLDQLSDNGIYVLNSIYPYGGDPAQVVSERIAAVRDHPAILFWVLGNEWNYNGLYVDLSHADSLERLNEVAALVKRADDTHPVATVYGELPSAETIASMPDIDVWGINAYRGISFGDLFERWSVLSELPMFIAEYGADAYNATISAYDPQSQAEAVRALTLELLGQASAFEPNGVTIGGTLFEWADEWWKDATGSADTQDIGGIAPGAGPYPDQVFNEEWWGLVDIDRQPRPAYEELQQLFEAP